MSETKSLCYWKELWKLTSHCNGPSHSEIVSKKLNAAQSQLEEGLCFFQPSSSESFAKLTAKHNEFPKVLSFIEKLQQFMDLESLQTWDIFCHYLSNQFHGTIENALKNFSFIDVLTSNLLLDVWRFYNSERIFMLKQLRLILESKDTDHVYNNEFKSLFKNMKLENLKKSLIKQFQHLVNEVPPKKSKNGDNVTFEIQKQWMERNLREQVEVLLLILLVIDESSLYMQEFKELFSMFKSHNFGRQPIYHKYLDDSNKLVILKIIYVEISIFYKIVNDARGSAAPTIIQSIKDDVENELIRLQHNEEHGALLLAWMLLLLEDSMTEELFISKYQHFGTKALQLRVFEFLHNMCKHSMFSGNTRCASIFKNSVYQLLCNICTKFDADGSISLHPFSVELCSELLHSSQLAKSFWNSIDELPCVGTVSIWNTALEYFPYDFKALSVLIVGLSRASEFSYNTLLQELDNLPLYTEIYKPRAVTISSVMNDEDSVLLTEDYCPYEGKDFIIQKGTPASIMDRRNATLIHFRKKCSYWKILHNELNHLIQHCLRGNLDVSAQIDKVVWGIRALHSVLVHLNDDALFNSLIDSCEAVFEVLVRFSNSRMPYVSLISACLDISIILIPKYSTKIFARLMNIGLLPYVDFPNLTEVQYSNGESFHTSLIGLYLVNVELPMGEYQLFNSYLDLINTFYECNYNDDIAVGILLPGLIFVLREVFPQMSEWHFKSIKEKRKLYFKCVSFIFKILQLSPEQKTSVVDRLLNKICIYSLLNTDNATALLKLVAFGENKVQALMEDEVNWINGEEFDHIKMIQMSMSALMQILRLKHLVQEKGVLSPLEHLIYTQPKQNTTLNVIPTVTGYMNHVFNKNLPNTACRLLRRFSLESNVSLLICLNMSPHQIRTMFLERLRDKTESNVLKTVILEFVASCVENQPGLTEVFFKISHPQSDGRIFASNSVNEQTDGILTYMAEYLSAVKDNTNSLYNPLLSRIMSLFHALWKNNMQMLVQDLRGNPDFWTYLCNPLFQDILPDIKAYSQIFNMVGIELFVFEGKVDKSLQNALENFFNHNNDYLKKWIEYIFSFDGREAKCEVLDEVPSWLSLLTSWKDFVCIIMNHLPFRVNTKNKITMVSLCLDTLNKEMTNVHDNRTIIILAEMYVTFLSNWKDDCFGDRQDFLRQISSLLHHTAASFESLHHRAKYSILSICTLSLNILTYELKGDKELSLEIVRAICTICNTQLDNLYIHSCKAHNIKEINSQKDDSQNIDLSSGVMALKLLEQSLYICKDAFLSENYFTCRSLISKLVYCVTNSVQKHFLFSQTTASLNCLTAFARSKLSKEILYCDIGQSLWLKFLPPKELSQPSQDGSSNNWQVSNWWQVYKCGIELVTSLLEKHGNYFSLDAIVFAGVQEEYLTESILLIRHSLDIEALNLTQSALFFVSQLIKFDFKWKHEHYQSLLNCMRSISMCLHYCTTLILRPRGIHLTVDRPSILPTGEETENPAPSPKVLNTLNKLLEIMHLCAVCLRSFSPNILNLLTDPYFETSNWQPLMELQFGAPKISSEPQLTFGTVMSAVCLLTRSLNYNYHADDTPLNTIKKHIGKRSPLRRRTSGGSGDDCIRRRTLRSDSVTSVSSTTSTTTINPNCLAALDKKLVLVTLENVLTLLASQALLAMKDPTMSTRDKQIVRRELCAELPVFHDFVKKKVIDLSHPKNYLCRRKHGSYPLLSNEEENKHLSLLNLESPDDMDENNGSLYTPPPPPPKRSHDSMRVSVVRKLHLDKAKTIGDPLSPRDVSDEQGSIISTPASKSSISSPSTSRSTKHVTWDDSLSIQEELLNPTEPEYSPLSEVQMMEEDYLHFLSNIFLYICQTDH